MPKLCPDGLECPLLCSQEQPEAAVLQETRPAQNATFPSCQSSLSLNLLDGWPREGGHPSQGHTAGQGQMGLGIPALPISSQFCLPRPRRNSEPGGRLMTELY